MTVVLSPCTKLSLPYYENVTKTWRECEILVLSIRASCIDAIITVTYSHESVHCTWVRSITLQEYDSSNTDCSPLGAHMQMSRYVCPLIGPWGACHRCDWQLSLECVFDTECIPVVAAHVCMHLMNVLIRFNPVWLCNKDWECLGSIEDYDALILSIISLNMRIYGFNLSCRVQMHDFLP